jgi:hypothetical protein
MSKHRKSDRSTADSKRGRKSVILKEKLDVIRMYGYNEFMVIIANATGIPTSIFKNC